MAVAQNSNIRVLLVAVGLLALDSISIPNNRFNMASCKQGSGLSFLYYTVYAPCI